MCSGVGLNSAALSVSLLGCEKNDGNKETQRGREILMFGTQADVLSLDVHVPLPNISWLAHDAVTTKQKTKVRNALASCF